MSITGCCFSPTSKVLITSSVDSDGTVYLIQTKLLLHIRYVATREFFIHLYTRA